MLLRAIKIFNRLRKNKNTIHNSAEMLKTCGFFYDWFSDNELLNVNKRKIHETNYYKIIMRNLTKQF